MYYLALGISTAIIAFLAVSIWYRTREPAFLLGTFFLYYWSLYGGWFIVSDKLSGIEESTYLEDKLFRVRLDNTYLETLCLYALFIIVVEVTILAIVKPRRHKPSLTQKTVVISHTVLITIAVISGFLSYLSMRSVLQDASIMGSSGYIATRLGNSPLYTLHQILDQLALFPTAIGTAVLFSGRHPRLISGRGGAWTPYGYLAVITGMFIFSVVLGNRGELFIAGTGGCLFYMANARHPKITRIATIAVLGVLGLGTIEITRGIPLRDLSENLRHFDFSLFKKSIRGMTSSSEIYAAHFSMYGVLSNDVPITWGSSFESLAASVVPRLFWSGRPPDVYTYYVQSVKATEGQGYTIHHATAWYLNFGILGVILGAFILGAICALCFNKRESFARSEPTRVIKAVALSMFTAYLPSLIRSGMEAYKGAVFESLLIPSFILTIAALKWSKILPVLLQLDSPGRPNEKNA